MAKRCAIFARVSTSKQDNSRQIKDLQAFATQKGWKISHIVKETISGAVDNAKRAGIGELYALAEGGKIDVILVTELSRLGRNAFQVQKIIEYMSEKNVSICIQRLGGGISTLDDNGRRSPMTDLLVSIVNQFSQMERNFLKDRIRSGLERARARGVQLGRRHGTAESPKRFLSKYRHMHDDIRKLSVRKVSRLHGVSPATVIKIKRAMAH